MPIRDTAAMNRSLDNDYGTTRGPNAPASHSLALFVGDPMTDGVEVSGNGYARVVILPADWAPAADGMKSLINPAEFPAPTAEWPDSPTYWALIGSDGFWWDCAPLTEPLDITSASPEGPLVDVTIFFDDAVTEAP